MKKILLLLSCLFGSAIAVQAQSFANNDKGVFLRAELRALARSKSDGVAQRGMDVEAIVGYRFDGRFSLFIPVTATNRPDSSDWASDTLRFIPPATGSK